jgi:hypothetical protein
MAMLKRQPFWVGRWACWFLLAAGLSARGENLIVDHNAVSNYCHIPQEYIDKVKCMWLDIPGESHSYGYRRGCELLEMTNSLFQVNVIDSGTPEGPTNAYLRVSRATWGDVSSATGWRYSYGEEDWYTSTTAIQRTLAHITYAKTNSREIAAIGFGWCWDTTWHNNPGGGTDSVYKVRWAGSSVGGPEGDLRWGLDAGDFDLTSNSVCMDTYLTATRQYMDYCASNNYATRVFFTTGPVDGSTGESGYQREIKHDYIRSYVAGMTNGILFDYADILCWSDYGTLQTTTWTDFGGTPRTYPIIHTNNMKDLDGSYTEDGDHIGQRGALRLGKALWWMLARIAGWDGIPRTSQGVPYSWLEAHNLVTNGYEAAAVSDTDDDQRLAWEEFWCDTNPTNRESCLSMTDLWLSETGADLYWKGGILATQYVERLSYLTLTDMPWQVIFTNRPPTAAMTNFLDRGGTNSQFFYRIRATR